ncbi:MAG TPA: hypothetical protein PLX33_11725 [Alphaproteobacteria bacterium]|nr:hypothetical protein [Alphaproteobacteria bacterium]
MALGPASSGNLAKKVLGLLSNIIPYALKKSGLPDDVANAMGAKGNFWAGVTLGAGAALLGGGMLLGALSGGALVAPGLLGTVLLNGAVAAAAVTAGGFLLRETAKELGGNLMQKIGRALFGKIFGGGSEPKDRYAEHRITPHMMQAVQGVSPLAAAKLKHRFAQAKVRNHSMVQPRPAFVYATPKMGMDIRL